MVNKFSRAQRRHDYRRLQKKRDRHWGYGKNGWRDSRMPHRMKGMVANTPALCSCPMCGNPRHNGWDTNEKRTIQERKFDEVWEYEIEEYDMNERDMAKYAALVATGMITEDALLEAIGDDSIVSQIMAMSGAIAVTGAVSGIVEDVVDTAFDVVDSINPFSGW
jgi:hypothetical protein